jgi:hypothetical protein
MVCKDMDPENHKGNINMNSSLLRDTEKCEYEIARKDVYVRVHW